MKYIIGVLLSLALLTSCNSRTRVDRPTTEISKSDRCPKPPTEPISIEINDREDGFYNAFNYQIRDIIADSDTIAFTSLEYKFTWCRGNDNWAIEPINSSQSDPLGTTTEITGDVRLNGKTYQYRVKLDVEAPREARQAIFELTTESSQPQQQILYTLEQTKQADAGIELGEPEISQPVVYNDRLFWTVDTYHGEGFGGIATIVSYDPATEQITVIQPSEIAAQIINDLVITENSDRPAFWIATQLTAEGNPYIPSLGLVAYHPENEDYTQGAIAPYRVDNSPIVGAIPTKLYLDTDKLWVGTGNGICRVNWQTIDREDSWSCWRFALMAEPNQELPVYRSLLDNTPDATIAPNENKKIEVLWWSLNQREPVKGRYEISYEPGMTVELSQGATTWSELYQGYQPAVWQPPLYWAGSNWHWEGDRFLRGLDEVELNMFGGGPMGIGSLQPNADYIFDHNALRGDLELLELTEATTKVRYYSAWVEDTMLQPYLIIVPEVRSPQSRSNPLLEIKSKIER